MTKPLRWAPPDFSAVRGNAEWPYSRYELPPPRPRPEWLPEPKVAGVAVGPTRDLLTTASRQIPAWRSEG